MKKNLLSIVVLISSYAYSQSVLPLSQATNPIKGVIQNNKAIGDTLWSEDFAGGLPSGWSVVNLSANSLQWKWDTIHHPGQFSIGISAINSTSRANGFMSLEMDLFNTPIPVSGAVFATTYFESSAIPITPTSNVELRLQQFSRFCCSSVTTILAQVSTDNFLTYDDYNLYSGGNFLNLMSSDPEYVHIDVSQTLSGEDTAYIRFSIDSLSHYFWMIDDVALVEVVGALEIDEQESESQLQISPNPSNGVFRINSLESILSIQILDISGRLIDNSNVLSESMIDLSTQKSGIYFAQIEMKNGSIVSKKLIKF